jgi:bifunctional non-homologous end joining protein LigD
MPPAKRVEVHVDGHRLSLSNLDKVLYPAVGFTKGHVLDYYTRIAPAVLPHLRDRPLTLKRYPNGVDRGHFYEKNAPSHRPSWVRTEPVKLRTEKAIEFVICDELPTLVWLANLADLELHPSLSKVPDVTSPTILAFDLDPGEGTTIVECAEVAVRLRAMLDQLGLQGFPKTSGSKGMQVYVPLNDPDVTYDQTKPFARALAQVLERAEPDLVVSEMAKVLRRGKVFVDWSQNDEHKTTVGVYSLRARERPTVSTPIDWSEVEGVLRSRDPDDLVFTAADVLERVASGGDRFAPVATLEQSLPRLT